MATNKQDKTTSQPIDRETAQIIAYELYKIQQQEAKRNEAQPSEKHEPKSTKQRASAKIENGSHNPNIANFSPNFAKTLVKWLIIGFYVVVEILLLIYLKQFIFI